MKSLLLGLVFAVLCCLPLTFAVAEGDTEASASVSSSNDEGPDVSGPHHDCMMKCAHERHYCYKDCHGHHTGHFSYDSCNTDCNHDYSRCTYGCTHHH